ncbi:hypothetical protein D3C81_2004890 [compost metagenome]
MWEGRYKSHLVANDEHLLRCYRYIELNPVQEAYADERRWSSYCHKVMGRADPLVHPHACHKRLAATVVERLLPYSGSIEDGDATALLTIFGSNTLWSMTDLGQPSKRK